MYQSSPPPDSIDASTLGDFHRCRRLYYLKHVEHWGSQELSGPLVHGGAMHAGLARWYESGSQEEALADLRSNWPGWPSAPVELAPMYSLARAEALLKGYINHYQNDPIKPFSHAGKPVLETVIEVPIEKLIWRYEIPHDNVPLGWSYFGVLDMLAEFDGGLWVVDHKTTKDMGDRWSYKWKPGIQMLGYAVVAEVFFDLPKPVCGVLINGIKMTEGVGGTRGMVFPPAEKANIEFRRTPVLFTHEEKRQWIIDRLEERATLEWHHKTGIFPPAAELNCSGYGKCQFHDVCGGNPGDFRRRLESDFSKGIKWDPRGQERI